MANEENLRNIELTHEEAVRNGAKGGLQLGINNKDRKSMAQIGQAIANHKPTKKVLAKARKVFPDLDNKEITNKFIMMSTLFQEAISGNIKAIEMFRDTIGEKPEPPTPQETGKTIYNIAATVSSIFLKFSSFAIISLGYLC